MIDVLMTLVVFVMAATLTGVLASREPREMRPFFLVAFFEYVVCLLAEQLYTRLIVEGGDALFYTKTGGALAGYMERDFGWAFGEVVALLVQRPSAFEQHVEGHGGNTASMSAVAALFQYFLGGGEIAASALASALAFFSMLAIFRAFAAAAPHVSRRRLFVATVLFPSTAFWICALHKESFCMMGIGLVCAGWRALYEQRVVRAVVYAGLGAYVMLIFRPPVLLPLVLGLAVYVILERIQRSRSGSVVIVGPFYLAGAVALVSLGMLAITRFSQRFSLEALGETMAAMQQNWSIGAGAGSDFMQLEQGTADASFGWQLARAPLALLNALFRPTLFDVHNVVAAVSAAEMTTMLLLVLRAVRKRGLGGTFGAIQRSPFMMMLALVTVVGCTFVGLVTFNLGSLARYRVPFLPFYGALVACLTAPASESAPVAATSSSPIPVTALSPRRPVSRQPRRPPRALPGRRPA